MTVKGLLATLLGLDASGDPFALACDENGYVLASLPGQAGGGTKRNPKGKLISPVGISPTGVLKNLQMDAGGNLIITLVGGSANEIIKSDGTDAEWANLAPLIVSEFCKGSRVYHSANQAIPSGVDTAVAFDTESYDTDTIHDTVTNNSRLTCKTAGKYLIMAGVLWAHNATSVRLMRLKVNNTISIAVETRPPVTAAGWATANFLLMTYSLAVNDYVEVLVNQGTGSALNVLAQGISTPCFAMQRVG